MATIQLVIKNIPKLGTDRSSTIYAVPQKDIAKPVLVSSLKIIYLKLKKQEPTFK